MSNANSHAFGPVLSSLNQISIQVFGDSVSFIIMNILALLETDIWTSSFFISKSVTIYVMLHLPYVDVL